ncbi:MAG TPA: hypothetical protein DCK87_07160 [Desulfotomaculum sp.]|nr:hypothetical protein [Desulfotomaculum sp.]
MTPVPGIRLTGLPVGMGQGDHAAYAMVGFAYAGMKETEPEGLAAWPPWARLTLYQGGLTILSLMTAVLVIAPLKPWTIWRTRRLNIS